MNKQKGFSTILLVVILLVIGGGVYFYFSQNKSTNIVNDEVDTIATTSSTTPVTKDILEKDSSIKSVNSSIIKIIYPNNESKYPTINKDGDQEFFRVNFGINYSDKGFFEDFEPTENLKIYLIDKSGNTIKNWKNPQTKEIFSNNTLTVDLPYDFKFNFGTEYTVKICDVIEGKEMCGVSDLFKPIAFESFNKQPTRIISISKIGDQKWELEADILTYNPKWSPANLDVPKYMNQNSKIRTLLLDQNTIINSCEDSNGNIVSGERMDLQKLVDIISNVLSRNGTAGESDFIQDIDVLGSKVTSTYEQCAG